MVASYPSTVLENMDKLDNAMNPIITFPIMPSSIFFEKFAQMHTQKIIKLDNVYKKL